jgi:hypothetical protein
MTDTDGLPLGVCVFSEPARNASRSVQYGGYVYEILRHAGVCFEPVSCEQLQARLPSLRLLLTVGETALTDRLQTALTDWLYEGGGWVSVGGVCGLERLLGVEVEKPAYSSWGGGVSSLGEGYLLPSIADHPVLRGLPLPLHYFNGLPVRTVDAVKLAEGLNAHQQPTGRAALTEATCGDGRCLLIAPDLTGTVVRIQQGMAVTRDGVGAPDGTAPVCDGVLKSDDGAVLDWIFDRQPVEGAPGLSGFLHPVADCWRELLLRALFHLAVSQQVALPLLWLYPRRLPALLHISHDTDENDPADGWQLLQTLREADIRTTWCVILPGYPPDLMRAIGEAGHELAMHYDAMTEGLAWSEAEFDRQWRQLTALFSGERPVTNKNHYLRWEGDTEFYTWCMRRGIELDQSKGASKTGEAGYNFGTCHLYRPVAPDGALMDVLELATPTQDMHIFAPEALLAPLQEAALRHHGILHLLYHPAHIRKPNVADSLKRAAAQAKARGMECWTAAQINRWERARQKAAWRDYRATPEEASVRLQMPEPLPDATLCWLTPEEATIQVDEEPQTAVSFTAWGFPFQSVCIAGTPVSDALLTLQRRQTG